MSVVSMSPPHWPEGNTVDSRGHSLWLTAVITPIFTGIFLLLRFYARAVIAKSIAFNDWIAFLTFIPIVAFSVCICQAAYWGAGNHDDNLSTYQSQGYYFWVLVSSEFYATSLGGYKAAIILLYIHLFGVNRKFRYFCYFVMFYQLSFAITNIIVEVAGCQPVSHFWNPSGDGKCIDNRDFDIAIGFGYMSSDLIIATMPLPMVWKLQLRNKREKIGLAFVLCSGYLAWAVAVIRYGVGTTDLTHGDRTYIAGANWILSVLEINTGLMCSCTPSFRQLTRSLREASKNRSLRRATDAEKYKGSWMSSERKRSTRAGSTPQDKFGSVSEQAILPSKMNLVRPISTVIPKGHISLREMLNEDLFQSNATSGDSRAVEEPGIAPNQPAPPLNRMTSDELYEGYDDRHLHARHGIV